MIDINILEIFSLKIIIVYFLIINVIGFLAMSIDKIRAKRGVWRIPENTLLLITVLGGGIGTIAGMYAFRHKTKKTKFTIGFPAILILEIILIIYLFIVCR